MDIHRTRELGEVDVPWHHLNNASADDSLLQNRFFHMKPHTTPKAPLF